jgi:serine/threonine protein kinase
MIRIDDTLRPFRARSFLLVIGLDHYLHEGRPLRPLRCPVKDVKAVAAALVSEGGVAEENVFTLCNEEATLLGISQALETIGERIRRLRREGPLANTRIVVFYSGHGLVGPGSDNRDTTYLATWETRRESAHLPVTALAIEQLDRMIEAAGPDQDLRFFDCCHAAGHAHAAKGEAGQAVATLMAAMTKARGRGVIYACDREELAWEMRDGSGSIFALALVEAIQRGAPDHGGVVDLHGIAHHVQQRVPELSLAEHGERQTPRLDLQQIDGPMPLAFRVEAFERRLRLVHNLSPRLAELASAGRLGLDRRDVEELCGRWFDPGTMRQALQIDDLLDRVGAEARLYDWLAPHSARQRLSGSSIATAATTASELSEGRTLDGYTQMQIKRRVGARTVYFAVAADGIPCVIKTLEGGNGDERGRFDQEGRLLERVKSTYFPRFFDRFRDPRTGLGVIVMERITGDDLADVMVSRVGEAFSRRASLDILRKLTEALEDLQAQGVVHRDLKPDNIIVRELNDDCWSVHLVDLGIAKDLDETQGTHLMAFIGTPLWMAPEQTDGGSSTPATDVYSLALITYWLLVGAPFWLPERLLAGDTVVRLHEAVRRGVIEPASERARWCCGVELPLAFDPVFARATAHRPEDRFESASDFFAALVIALSAPSGQVAGGSQIPERPPPISLPAPAQIAPRRFDLDAPPLPTPRRRLAAPILTALFLSSGGLFLLPVVVSGPTVIAPPPIDAVASASATAPRPTAPAIPPASASANASVPIVLATAKRPRAPPQQVFDPTPQPMDAPPLPARPEPPTTPEAAKAKTRLCIAKYEDPQRSGLQCSFVVDSAGVHFSPETNLSANTRQCVGLR